jgi:hypothetical protein
MNIGLSASQAGVALLQAANLTTVSNFYAEIEDPDNTDSSAHVRSLPCVVCYFSDATEYPLGTGNYSGTLFFQVEGSADDMTAAEFEAVFDEVFAAISIDTLAADISAAGDDFTCFGLTGGLQQTAQTINGRIRVKSLAVPMNCCALDVA